MIEGHALVEGKAAGNVLTLDEPLSFWGGLNPKTGLVTDRRHPQFGVSVAGKVTVMPFGRCSSSASSVLAEAVRLGTAPAAIVMKEPDEIIVIGVLVAAELYGTVCPVIVVAPGDYGNIAGAQTASIERDGSIIIW